MVTNFSKPWRCNDRCCASQLATCRLCLVVNRGLTNEELQLADYHIQIPANAAVWVLNVAAAVQVIASVFYETAGIGIDGKNSG